VAGVRFGETTKTIRKRAQLWKKTDGCVIVEVEPLQDYYVGRKFRMVKILLTTKTYELVF